MLANRSREGRAFAPPFVAFVVFVAFFVILSAAMLGGQGSAAAGAARAKVKVKAGGGHAGEHPGKTHRRHARPRCLGAGPRRTHGKSKGTGKKSKRHGAWASRREVSGSREVSGLRKVPRPHKVKDERRPKNCPATRRSSKQPLIVLAPFAPSQPSSPGGIDPTLTPAPGPAATAPPGPATTAPPKSPPVEGSFSKNCFSAPGACGYPDPRYGNVGPSVACSSLTPSGSVDAGTAGETIQNMDITGEVAVSAKNVTITNDCISSDGGGTLGSRAVTIDDGVTGTQITHSNIGGANSTAGSIEEALSNNYANANTVADHDYIHNCGECVHGAWTLTNSYVIVNGTVPNCGSECPDHYEDIYCDSSTFVAEHDVLLNPEGQTAVLFCDTNGGSGGAALNHITLTGSLVAGGGYTLYPQGNSSSVGSSTMDISDNRFARCLTTPVHNDGTECEGGPDSHGYWPFSGYYGLADSEAIYCPPISDQVWSNNVWDDDNQSIGCE